MTAHDPATPFDRLLPCVSAGTQYVADTLGMLGVDLPPMRRVSACGWGVSPGSTAHARAGHDGGDLSGAVTQLVAFRTQACDLGRARAIDQLHAALHSR